MEISRSPIVRFVAVIFAGLKFPPAHQLGDPDFQSDWMLMESQNKAESFRVVEHGLSEVPLKVKVLARPRSGTYSSWIFEASTAQQADDDVPWLYCGVIFTYNITHVQLFVPHTVGDDKAGRAFCVDSSSWTSGTNSSTTDQIEQYVLVKVMAWRSSSFPGPDMDSGWIYASSSGPHFMEVAHNLGEEVSLVLLQIRCTPYKKKDQTIYSEGVGSGSKPTPTLGQPVVSGLVFAYNNSHVRIWIANKGYSSRVLCVRDGFGEDSDGFRCKEGDFRIRAWKTLGQRRQRFSFTLTELVQGGIPDMSSLLVNIRQWDPWSDYISVQVKALDGPNEGFLFPGIGQDHRNAYHDSSYGGVMFAYSAEKIRIFVPANESGTMIHIPDNWGIPEYNQMSNNVEIVVMMWSVTSSNHCTSNTTTVGWFRRLGVAACSGRHSARSSALCLGDVSCVGVIPCRLTGQPQQLDLDDVNKRLVEGVLGANGEMLLKTITCI